MAFPMNADHIAPQEGGFEPQRQNHFDVEFYGVPGIDELSLSIATANMPGTSNDPITIPFRNEERHVAGPARVDDFAISFRDYVDAQVHNAIMTWRLLVFEPASARVGRAATYKRRGKVFLFGPDGEVERSWDLIGVWPTNDPPLAFDSASGDQLLLDVTFKVDKVIPSPENYIGL
jgi:hypothetical protein